MRAENESSREQLLVFAAFAVGQGLYINDGHRDPVGLMWILLAMLALVRAMKRSVRSPLDRSSLRQLLAVCLVIQWSQLLLWGIRGGVPGKLWVEGFVGAMVVAGIGGMLLLLRGGRMPIGLLLVGHTFAGVCAIRAVPEPYIDVWYLQQNSAAALLRGENPYTAPARNIYEPDTSVYGPGVCKDGWLTVSHPYPPLTLLLATLGRAMGDVRWTYLVAIELTAVVMMRRASSASFAALFLLTPSALLVVQSAWTEPMILLLLATIVLTAQTRPWLLWLPLGLFLSSKQYSVIFLPLLLLLERDRAVIGRTLLKAGALACAIMLPFLIWNPAAFYRNVVWWHLNCPFRIDCLSFPALVAAVSGLQLPTWLAFACAGGAIVWTMRNAERSTHGFAIGSALVFLVFVAMNRQAFCNYYFLIVGITCVAASTRRAPVALTEVLPAPLAPSRRIAA